MDTPQAIEQACRARDHAALTRMVGSLADRSQQSDAISRTIAWFDGTSDRDTYLITQVEWFLEQGDLSSAQALLKRCRHLGIDSPALCQLVYESTIQPNEALLRKRFTLNVALLRETNCLVTPVPAGSFDFDYVKQHTALISPDVGRTPAHSPSRHTAMSAIPTGYPQTARLVVDTTDLARILDILDTTDLILLVYDDPRLFQAFLLYEDLSLIQRALEVQRILIFIDPDRDALRQFLADFRNPFPSAGTDHSSRGDYAHFLAEVAYDNDRRLRATRDAVNRHYASLDRDYYRRLLAGPASAIKVLLITSRHTVVNKHICANWHMALRRLGHDAELHTEDQSYQVTNENSLLCHLARFTPDIIFHINYDVKHVLSEEAVIQNILWLMRYRDTCSFGGLLNYSHNMFAFPFFKPWISELVAEGMPEDRMVATPDGVDIDVFLRREDQTCNNFSCDIVSVNNSAGNDVRIVDSLLRSIEHKAVRTAIWRACMYIEDLAREENFLFYPKSAMRVLDSHLSRMGIDADISTKNYLALRLLTLMQSHYRRRVMEWIIDSRLTENIQLWGSGWSNYSKFDRFYRGIADYGEPLSRIYNVSRISLSDMATSTLHERNFEIMASGGFPLIAYAAPENSEDVDSITDYFVENDEVVLFYSKDDLLGKIAYFLEHPEERERIAINGERRTRQEFSTTAVAQKVMDFVKHWYEAT